MFSDNGAARTGFHDPICSICSWGTETGAHDATLDGHTCLFLGLAVHGDRLFSASNDGTIRVWALGTWAALHTVGAGAEEWGKCPLCLVVSGRHLVSGSVGYGSQEVRVRDLKTLELQHTRPQPSSGLGVRALLAVKGTVWAGVGQDVVVWVRGV